MAPVAPSAFSLTSLAAPQKAAQAAWQNHTPPAYDRLEYERKPAGGAYAVVSYVVPGTLQSYIDNSVEDGRQYYGRVRAWSKTEGYSPYSNEDSAIIPLRAPSGLAATSNAGGTQASLSCIDNSQNETSFKWYYRRKGASTWILGETTGANVNYATIPGLTPGAEYEFTAKAWNAVAGYSPASNIETLVMADPPAKPSNLVALAIATDKVALSFQDNSDNETDFRLEYSTDGVSFSALVTLGAGVTTHTDEGLSSLTHRWYRVRAHNASGYSGYSNVADTWTWAAISPPTNVVLTAAMVNGVYGIEITFDDNSSLEDAHCVEIQEDGGGYVEVVQLAPNRTYYHYTGISPESVYDVRIRAKQGAAYSNYSTVASITVPGVPATPGPLVVVEYQDTWVTLTWEPVENEEGYIIYISDDGGSTYDEILRVLVPGVNRVKIPNLTPDFLYHFGLRSYNGAGASTYMSEVEVTTRAAYEPSALERLLRRTAPEIVYPCEVGALLPIGGMTLVSGRTYTYEADFDEGGLPIDDVRENGASLTAKTSIAEVEAAAGSWWHDPAAAKLYVHASDGTDPANFHIAAVFRMRFTTGHATWYGTDRYLPFLPVNGIPDVTQSLPPYWDGSFSVSTGRISLLNPYVYRRWFWDKLDARYGFFNRRVVVYAGGPDFSYSELVPVLAGTINGHRWSPTRMEFDLRDLRDGIHRNLPAEKYSLDDFPLMDENIADKVRPRSWGPVTGLVPGAIDATNKVYELNNGRVKSVAVRHVSTATTTLTENTDYFVDYRRGRITLARDFTLADTDILEVDFTAGVNLADEAVQNGPEIFLDIATTMLPLGFSDIDLDMVYEAKAAKTAVIGLCLKDEKGSQDIFRILEKSCGMTIVQTNDGRLGLRAVQMAPGGGAPHVSAGRVFEISGDSSQDQVYAAVEINYGQNQNTGAWQTYTKTLSRATYESGVTKPLPVDTALVSADDAAALAAEIAGLLEKMALPVETDRCLHAALPGDVVYASADRAPTSSGQLSMTPVRITELRKSISGGRSSAVVEVV